MTYDFSKLNDREFEELGGDIIGEALSLKVESFKAGKDGGVDGRFWIGNSQNEGIIQCKHYLKTGYKGLIYVLKKDEVEKVKKLKPEKYIFITSLGLSKANKKEIKELFKPYIKREDDIWGQEDLNKFLLENQKLVERHYKLWITSTQILDIIFNNAVIGRSKSTIKEIEDSAKKYVLTENHKKAIEILEKENVLIITGEPGVGKTTLADNLSLFYTANGYEFCDIEESIEEAENLYREDIDDNIIFYYDDFLGSHLYDAINNKKDSHIVKFINRIKKDPTKKFILTSRTNILNFGESTSPSFENKKIRKNEFLLEVKSLSELDKAMILYSHIYSSYLPKELIDEIYRDKKYKEIVNHKNFNPRTIEFITDIDRLEKEITPKQYWDYVVESLDNPYDIWAQYFQSQSDDPMRYLVYLTAFNNGMISENLLRESYERFKSIRGFEGKSHHDDSFNFVTKNVTGSLLNRTKGKGECRYTLINPSLADFVLNAYFKDSSLILDILKSIKSVSSLRYLELIKNNNKLEEKKVSKIQTTIFNDLFDEKIEEEDFDYLISLSYSQSSEESIESKTIQLLNKIVSIKGKELNINKVYEFLFLLNYFNDFGDKVLIESYDFLVEGLRNTSFDGEDLKVLLEFVKDFNIDDKEVIDFVEDKLNCYFEEELDSCKADIDLNKYVKPVFNDDDRVQTDYEVDDSGIREELESIIDNSMYLFDSNTIEKFSFYGGDVVRDFDVGKMVDNYIEDIGIDSSIDLKNYFKDSSLVENDIDAIFERG